MTRPVALPSENLRILAVSETWQGANDYAFVRAFRRAGHSVRTLSQSAVLPDWRSPALKVVRRLLQRRLAAEFNHILIAEAQRLRPDLLFVFKGSLVFATTLRQLRDQGVTAVQFYPDVSFRTHGPYLPEALREYDHVFTSKSFGLKDMAEQLGITAASFLPHGFDPETHRPLTLSAQERCRYRADASFVGDWSPHKAALLSGLMDRLPNLDLKIWGPARWRGARGALRDLYQGQPVYGLEYAKVIQASRINIALLSERRAGASSGDQMTARSFEIPACGGFMLHQRTDEVLHFFAEGRECACFSDADELARQVTRYLQDDDRRQDIAGAGRLRCNRSGYAADDRVAAILDWYARHGGRAAGAA